MNHYAVNLKSSDEDRLSWVQHLSISFCNLQDASPIVVAYKAFIVSDRLYLGPLVVT